MSRERARRRHPPKQVYRVEDDAGHGPYRYIDALGNVASVAKVVHVDGWDPFRHPTSFYVSMGIIEQGSPWVFGFRTKVHMRRWFNVGERKRLRALGWALSHYHIARPKEWLDEEDWQLVFHRRYAELIKREEL